MFQQAFYPQQQQQAFTNNNNNNNRATPIFFMGSHPFFYRSHGPVLNQSTHNLNFTHDFDRFSTTQHHGFSSIPSNGYPFYDYSNQNFDQQHRWRQNINRNQHRNHHQPHQHQHQQHHRRPPAFHFQDKSTSYFMTDPIITHDDRITIQLTKVHIGPNGDQQRVFVEQDFSNEQELNKFVRNLRQNFEKTFNNRSSTGHTNTDESTSTNSKKSGVVVVEEPDEEPKIYQQQAYNEKIESRKAASSILTPPSSPTMGSTPPRKSEERSPPASSSNIENHRRKHASPSASQMSSASTTRSNRHHHHRNKMKYRRQHTENPEDFRSSRLFQMPSFSRQYQATPTPSRFQQRFFHPNNDFNNHINPNAQWRFHQNGYPKNRSRSYAPPINDHHFPPPPATPSNFQNVTDRFFRPVHPRSKEFPPPSPAKFRHMHRRKMNQPTIIAENLIYPNNAQQQPRVHRTKSECEKFEKQKQKRSHSTTNHFQNFLPLKQTPIIQKHFIPFRSPPVMLRSIHAKTPIFYPNQRRQFTNVQQPKLRLINQFRLGTNRF